MVQPLGGPPTTSLMIITSNLCVSILLLSPISHSLFIFFFFVRSEKKIHSKYSFFRLPNQNRKQLFFCSSPNFRARISRKKTNKKWKQFRRKAANKVRFLLLLVLLLLYTKYTKFFAFGQLHLYYWLKQSLLHCTNQMILPLSPRIFFFVSFSFFCSSSYWNEIFSSLALASFLFSEAELFAKNVFIHRTFCFDSFKIEINFQ